MPVAFLSALAVAISGLQCQSCNRRNLSNLSNLRLPLEVPKVRHYASAFQCLPHNDGQGKTLHTGQQQEGASAHLWFAVVSLFARALLSPSCELTSSGQHHLSNKQQQRQYNKSTSQSVSCADLALNIDDWACILSSYASFLLSLACSKTRISAC